MVAMSSGLQKPVVPAPTAAKASKGDCCMGVFCSKSDNTAVAALNNSNQKIALCRRPGGGQGIWTLPSAQVRAPLAQQVQPQQAQQVQPQQAQQVQDR